MTTEELILGHFDESLTPAQERRLQELLDTSSDARSLFEQHGALQRMLTADAGALAPSSRLDDMAIAAALGAAPEMIAGGATAWISGKVAAAIAVAAAGGVSVALFLSSGAKPVTPVQAPAGRTAPAAAPVVTPSPAGESLGSDAPVTVDAPPVKEPVKMAARTAPPEVRAITRKPRRARAAKPLRIDTNGTDLEHQPKTVPSDGR